MCTANDVKVSFGSLEIFVCGGAVQEKLRILLRYILKADAAWRAYLRVHTPTQKYAKNVYLPLMRQSNLINFQSVIIFWVTKYIVCVVCTYTIALTYFEK